MERERDRERKIGSKAKRKQKDRISKIRGMLTFATSSHITEFQPVYLEFPIALFKHGSILPPQREGQGPKSEKWVGRTGDHSLSSQGL